MAKKSEVISNAALGALTNANSEVHAEDVSSVAPSAPVQKTNAIDSIFSEKLKNSTEINPEFTGVARSVVCLKNQGFNNFQILTITIEKGKVVKIAKSDPWANFETIAILDHVCHLATLNLNDNFEDKKAWQI